MASSFVTIHLALNMTTRLDIGGPTSSTNHPDPLAAPTPPVEPTLAPTRPSRPAPLAIIQYYSGGKQAIHSRSDVRLVYAEPPMEDLNSPNSQY
eukprot:scaffold50891_cov63-Phaeocystis_antarctica.AAC.4